MGKNKDENFFEGNVQPTFNPRLQEFMLIYLRRYFYTVAYIVTKEGSMATARWSIDTWQDLFRTLFRPEHVAFFPHKVFRWDSKGIYQDCYYPFPCEHLLGGEALLGKSVKEVLPKNVSYSVQKALSVVLHKGLPQEVQCVFQAGKQFTAASIRLFPYDSEVLGFVTDHDMSGRPLIHVTPDHPSIRFLKNIPSIFPVSATIR